MNQNIREVLISKGFSEDAAQDRYVEYLVVMGLEVL